MGDKIVIIGGVACGPKAGARARRRDPEAEITIIERGQYISFAGCGLPYYVGGVVPKIDQLFSMPFGAVRDEAYFKAAKDIEVLTGTEATAIDCEKKAVRIKELATGEERDLPYDKLVVSTGAVPRKAPFPGGDLENVWNLWTIPDAEAIKAGIEAGQAERICIIGAGLIGLEAAEALINQGVETTIVDIMPQPLFGLLDADMAELVAHELRAQKLALHLGETVKAMEGEGGKVARVVTDRRQIEVDGVILAMGAGPNVELAKACGLKLGETGAILVDEHLCTSDPHIYAGGDCVENLHIVTGRKVTNPLGSTANIHGRVIGDNLTGASTSFPGVVGTGIMRTLGTNVGCAGITQARAKELGYDPVSAINPANDKSHFYPGGKQIAIKAVADKKSGKLLGVQIVGPGDVARRVDAAACALRFGAGLDEMSSMDLCYAPPFGTAIDPLAHTINIVKNKLDGLLETISAADLKKLLAGDDDFILLDVRTEAEFGKRPMIDDPRARSVEMTVLRKQIPNLDREKLIIIICQAGPRSYDVQCMLRGAGLKTLSVEGGMSLFLRTGG